MNFGFLVQKWPFCDAHLLSKKKRAWNPYFYSVLGVSTFGAKVSKKGNFEKPPKKRKFWLITEKLFFGIYAVFWGPLFSCFFFSFAFLGFFGGLKGQVRWPEGPPHLALNPPYLFLLFLLFCCFVFCFVFFGFLIQKKFFLPEKGIFCLFSVFLFLSPLAFFGLPLFLFLFTFSKTQVDKKTFCCNPPFD